MAPAMLRWPWPPEAYFYYFTDSLHSQPGSKYRALEEELIFMWRHRASFELLIVDRDRLPPPLWDAIVRGLDIKSYPALVASPTSLRIEDTKPSDTSYTPPEGAEYIKVEAGLILDEVLSDRDRLRELLNKLFDAAREGDLKAALRRLKLEVYLKKLGEIILKIVQGKPLPLL